MSQAVQTNVWLPISQIAADVQTGDLKAVDLVKKALEIIDEKSDFKAIIATTANRALSRAAEIDKQAASGESVGALAGVPFIAKDNFLIFGADTTAASNILKGFDAPYQATVINRLEAAGAICVAKANLDAFGHGGSTENSDFMITKNPHDKDRVSGGSSGGSAAAVALEMAPFALGTDTGGSSRQPASFVGCIGYKPTYGLISRSGIVAMASSSDTVGVLTRSVDDLALVLDVSAGRDELDSTTIERQASYYPAEKSKHLTGIKIGAIKEFMGDGLEPAVRTKIKSAIDKLSQAGADVKEVSIPSIDLALAAYYVITPAEVGSNLSRYDGQRYGYSADDSNTLEESYEKTRSHGFGKEAKRRIMLGAYVLSSGYYEAYYKQAALVRTKIINEFKTAFEQFDFLAGPTASGVAFKIGEKSDDPLQMYLSDVMTVGANLAGLPAISLPAGQLDGLPVGLQLMAPPRSDKALLDMASSVMEVLA